MPRERVIYVITGRALKFESDAPRRISGPLPPVPTRTRPHAILPAFREQHGSPRARNSFCRPGSPETDLTGSRSQRRWSASQIGAKELHRGGGLIRADGDVRRSRRIARNFYAARRLAAFFRAFFSRLGSRDLFFGASLPLFVVGVAGDVSCSLTPTAAATFPARPPMALAAPTSRPSPCSS
jgi:hypothetical protein